MIERDLELEAIDALLARGGGALLIEGEAGIGKTALLACARSRAAASGLRVLHALADATEARVPLAGARVLLARAVGPGHGLGELALQGSLADPSADQVIHALWWLIVELAAEEPLALVFDDAQWADPLTVGLLRLVARRAEDVPLLLIVAARPGTSLGAERAFERLEPGPLSPAGAAALLGRPAEDAWEATRGNPLYLTELARSNAVPPPQLVRLIEDRLARLSPDAAAVARAVAILGPDANAVRVRALAGVARTEAAEHELRRERLVEDFAFVHPLVGEAARASIPAPLAADLHAEAATLLDDETRIAEHLVHAPPRGSQAVVATLRRAAAAARRVGAPDAAARLLERAHAEPPSAAAADAVAFELGRALLEATGDDAPLARLAPRHTDAARHLARHYALSGRAEEAVAVLRAAPAPDEETRLELLAEATVAAAAVPGAREAARKFAAAPGPAAPPSAAAAPGPAGTPAERLLFVASRVVAGEAPGDPVEAARGVLALRLHRHFHASYAVGELTFSAVSLLINGDALDDAERAMVALRADAEAAGQPSTIAGTHWQQAQIAYQRGDLARCEAEARAAAEIGGAVLRPLADPWRVLALVEQGRLDEAEALVPAAIGPSGLLQAAIGSRGRLRLAGGDFARAIDDLAEARNRVAAHYRLLVEPPWQPLLAEALVLAGRTAEAAAEAEAYAEAAAYWGTPRAQGQLARMRALTAARGQAIALLEQAAGHFAQTPLERARVLVELGARQGAAGERTVARATLREGFDAAHACGATALAQRARDELRLVGGRPRTPAGGELTPAERRVADLAAGGATNREIARRLFLSPKTVEMHLRSAYRKLGIKGRAGLRPGSGTG